ncbi:MAG: tetratricopeptide repeat protein [Bradymonadales bacterium]|nr:tetratricopeptide repeat protein [Bradymonadales bacterium]
MRDSNRRLLWFLIALVPMALVAVIVPLVIWGLVGLLLLLLVVLHLLGKIDMLAPWRGAFGASRRSEGSTGVGSTAGLDERLSRLAATRGVAGDLFMRVQREDWDEVGQLLAEIDLAHLEEVVITLIVLGKLPVARRLVELGRERLGAHGRLWYHQGVAAVLAGDLGEAISSYRAATEADAAYPPAFCYLAAAWVEQGDSKQAVECAEEALRLLPEDPLSWTTAALVYAFRGDRDRIRALVEELPERLRDLEPSFERLLQLDQLDPMRWVHRFPLHAEAAYGTAAAYLEQERLDLAEPLLKRSLALDPYHLKAAADLGLLYSRLDRDQDACQLYDQTLQQVYGSSPLRFNKGNCLLRLGRLEEALGEFERCLEANPDWLDARINLCSTLVALGQLTRAEEELERIKAAGAAPPVVEDLTRRIAQANLTPGPAG